MSWTLLFVTVTLSIFITTLQAASLCRSAVNSACLEGTGEDSFEERTATIKARNLNDEDTDMASTEEAVDQLTARNMQRRVCHTRTILGTFPPQQRRVCHTRTVLMDEDQAANGTTIDAGTLNGTDTTTATPVDATTSPLSVATTSPSSVAVEGAFEINIVPESSSSFLSGLLEIRPDIEWIFGKPNRKRARKTMMTRRDDSYNDEPKISRFY